MAKYVKDAFAPRRTLHGYANKKWNFAFIMRSIKVVCIDIDGKNGGLEYASKLGYLPPTLAETSKSGNGYHLFYEVDDKWDDVEGFARFRDQIGIVQGVDIRATGCVYHYPQQRWNWRNMAKLPKHLEQQLLHKIQTQQAAVVDIKKKLELDPVEVAIMQDELLDELKKPIADGKRNNTLFAIGSKMKLAQVPGWEEHVQDRAGQVGLKDDEIEKLVRNIDAYGG